MYFDSQKKQLQTCLIKKYFKCTILIRDIAIAAIHCFPLSVSFFCFFIIPGIDENIHLITETCSRFIWHLAVTARRSTINW